MYLSSGEICEVLSIPYPTLDGWIRKGIVKPAIGGKLRGADRYFSLVDVLAIAAGRGLRASGFTLKVAGRVTDVLMNISEARLQKNFRDGRNFLVITTEDVLPRMIRADAIPTVPEIEGLPLRPMALDVKTLFDRIVSRCRQLKGEAENVEVAR
jgi:DNA-binding transcriptional MerR regulator